jgi:hypothetical protein
VPRCLRLEEDMQEQSDAYKMKVDTNNAAVLIQAPYGAGCQMCAAWLARAAEAEALWIQALEDREFGQRVSELYALVQPNFEAAALELLPQLKSSHDVVVFRFDLDNFDYGWRDSELVLRTEFVMMCRLGFFWAVESGYEMSVPATLTLAQVKQAAMDIIATRKHTGDGVKAIHPEAMLTMIPLLEAEARRAQIIAMRDFDDLYRRGSVQ